MKIGFLITARLKSKRLPLKILRDLNGKTVIERVIDRAKSIDGIDEIVLCTSSNKQDQPLITIAEHNSISYFLGDEDDVLQRLHDAAKKQKFDSFLSITADNPLFSIHHSNVVANELGKGRYDYIKIIGLPLGCAVYGIDFKAITTICQIKKLIDTEIWGYLFEQMKLFNIKIIETKGIYYKPNFRLTLDYQDDYELLYNLYKNIHFDKILDLTTVLKYLNNHPEIATLNSHCIQRDIDDVTKNKIRNYYKIHFNEIQKIKEEIYTNIKQ